MSYLQYEPRYVSSFSGLASVVSNTRWHDHPTWQLELFISGEAKLRFEERSRTANDGDMVIIPARVTHRFRYPVKDTRYITIQFELPKIDHNYGVVWLPSTTAARALRTAIIALLEPGKSLSDQEVAVLEVLLKGFVGLYFETAESVVDPHAIGVVEATKAYIETNCDRPLTVREVAAHVGYSANHLSALFKRVENVSTKRYIDRSRAQLIQQYLVHSDLAISDIAITLGFNDAYSFSRFFKKECSVSPRQLRRQKVVPRSPLSRGK